MNATGIILAGGKSSRMGEDKGLINLNGKPMIQHIIDVIKPLFSEVIIISNNKAYESFGLTVFEDIYPDKGPVGGIYTGLFHSPTDINFCSSCDVPFISKELVLWLLKNSENERVTLPKSNGKTHQMIGIYNKKTLPFFKENIKKNNLKLSQINHDLDCKVISIEKENTTFNEIIFSNINSKNDLKNIENGSNY